MSRIMKWATTAVAVLAMVTIFTPAVWSVSHSQALTNVLLGQFAALAIGHTAYRVASGKPPSVRSAVAGIVCGLGLAISPMYFGLVSGFTSANMISGGLIILVGVYAIASKVMGEEEEQRLPEMRTEQSPEEPAKLA